MIRRPRLLAAAAFLVLLASASPVLADGGYVPEKAYAAMPTIPMQRALIVHKDGMETLVVESTFDSASPGVGWILPLPAAPTRIEVADGGILTSLAVFLRPEVIHDLFELFLPAILILGFLVPLCLVIILSKSGPGVWGVILWGVYYTLFLSLSVPAGFHAGEGGADAAAVQVLSTQKVGHYDVSVLTAADGGAVSQWLAEQGLQGLGTEARATVDDYAARGWCFAVARLRRDAGGTATPHPLSVTFPAAEPVYPMRLTRMAGSTTHVELYVISDRMAAADGFHLAFADQYHGLAIDPNDDRRGFMERRGESLWALSSTEAHPLDPATTAPLFESRSFRIAVALPSLVPVMWDNCIVSRLEADLPPEAMTRDVEVRWADYEPHQDTFFSARGRRDVVLSFLLWAAIPLLVFVSAIFAHRQRPSRRQARILVVFIGLVLTVAAVGGLWHRVVPVTRAPHSYEEQMRNRDFSAVAQAMAAQGHLHRNMTDRQLEEALASAPALGFWHEDAAAVAAWSTNPYTGGPVHYERSPGDFATRRINDEVWLCLYDRNGFEERVVALPPRYPGAKGEE